MIASLATTLVGVNLLAYAMVQLRPKLYGTKLYKPMLKNIQLSIIPILVLMALVTLIVVLQAVNTNLENQSIINGICVALMVVMLGAWVLLLPNAGYLITELNFNHRDNDQVEVPLWYDIVGVLALAMSGVMNMCFNVFVIQFMVALVLLSFAQNISFAFESISWLTMGLLMILASFGIYLGRYLRLNSWDVKHPIGLLKKMKKHFGTGESRKNGFLFVLFHSLFFILYYRATMGVVLEQLLLSIQTF